MAFDLANLKKMSASLAPFSDYNDKTGSVAGSKLGAWLFDASASYSNNSTAEVIAANYFDGASGFLNVGDFIFALTNNPAGIVLRVATNAGGAVTTAQID